MQREDLKDLSREQLERLICEWTIRYHDLKEEFNAYKRECEYLRNKTLIEHEETVKSQREKIDSLLKELEEEKGKTITISDGAITMRADMWEALNENKALKDENTALKQRIKDLEDVCDGSCFSDEEDERDKLIAELQDQHQQDCIRYNDMRTAYLVTLDELARLRERFGVGR